MFIKCWRVLFALFTAVKHCVWFFGTGAVLLWLLQNFYQITA